MPRTHCGPGWDPHLVGYNFASNAIIFVCYMVIGFWLLTHSVGLKNLTGEHTAWIWKIWAMFIISCGFTHLQDAVIFYFPTYRLDTILRVITSFCSALALFTLPVLSRSIIRGVKILTVCSYYTNYTYVQNVENSSPSLQLYTPERIQKELDESSS